MSHNLFKSEKGAVSLNPCSVAIRTFAGGILTAARLFLYLLDAVRLILCGGDWVTKEVDVVIFDRYIYDELPISISRIAVKAYVHLLLMLVPLPALLSCVMRPEQRSPQTEYPLDFCTLRASYWCSANPQRCGH